MKRIRILCLIVVIIIISINININTTAGKKLITITTPAPKVNGITLISNDNFNVEDIKNSGFKTVFLYADTIRYAKKPYNTNYKSLKMLEKNIKLIEKANLNYVICFTSGPGFSNDGKIATIFQNNSEKTYFSKMVKEVVKRYWGNKNFIAASIGIHSSDIAEDKYYLTQNYIIDNVRKNYSNLKMLYNLHPLSYEENFNNLPDINLKEKNIILNLEIELKGLSYPGYGAGYKTSFKLNKNAVLSNLEKFKEYQDKSDVPTIVTLKTPWVNASDIFLQDSYEIFKILGFEYNLCYGNSHDLYDFTRNKSVLNVVVRNNR